MLTVRFYKNFTKRSNSTKQPGSSDLYDSFPSLLKSGCTVTSPTIEVAISTSDPAALGYNYAYISDFSRYYFVNEWTYNMGLWIADLTVDVLASFKTEIGATEKYVLRSSSDYDETIVDTFYPVRNAWSSVESDIPTPFSYANRSYIIGFISAPAGTINANSQGSITYYYATEAQVVQIIRYLMSHDFIGSNLVDTVVGLTEQAVKDFVDPLQYIASVTFFPFDARSSAILPSVKPQIGWYDTSNDSNIPSLVRIDSLTMQFSGNSYRVAIPENLYASGVKQYLAYAPYTRHAAHIEPFGTIPLDTDLMVGREYMYCCYDVDLVTGLCRLSIGTDDKRGDLAICTAAVGVPISLSQITTDVISGTLAAAGGIIGAVAAGSAGDIAGAASSVVSGIGSAVNALKPQVSTTGANGSIIAYNGANLAKLIMQYVDIVGTDINEFGAPLCTACTINTLSGFVKCADSEHSVAALASEKEQIGAYMMEGFFYE